MVQKISGLYLSNSWLVGTASAWPRTRYGAPRSMMSARMSLPWTIDFPNLVPNPSSASAVAVNVWFNLTGSTFSEIDVTVSNNVLISVVTEVTSITSCGAIRCGTGLFGDVNDTYL